MSKRGADNYLTDQNWENDEEPQEAGAFTQASDSVMQGRQVKKAKRRGLGDDSGSATEGASAGAFKGFGGFGSSPMSTTPSFTFSGFGSSSASSGSSSSQSNGAGSGPTFGSGAKAADSTITPSGGSGKGKLSNGTSKSSGNRTKHMSQLKALNEGILKWIKQHVDSNPYCILTPICADYEKYLKEIEQKYPYSDGEKASTEETTEKPKEVETEKKEEEEKKDSDPAPASTAFGSSGSGIFGTASVSSGTGYTFGSAAGSTTTSTSAVTSTFSFSKDTSGDAGAAKPAFGGFNFGSTGGGLTGTSGFSFASAKPGGSSDDKSSSAANAEDEEYVPPKDEVKEIKEDDAYYTKRCKLFFKKGESWVEKGLGNLHLKDCDGKTQLLIRADTNLGNILLNIMVTGSIPASRQGKNNVAMICIPNPPLNEKDPDDKTPVSMLIRVKTGDDADELFEKLQAAKNK